ncbi:hypothetical protein D9M71_512990 [compost metagenome]
MKASNLILSLVLSSAVAPYVLADNDAKHLITSCKELLRVYSKRDEQHLLAGLTTSTSDALRAGYCRGVLDEFRRTHMCVQNDWFAQAAHIAVYSAQAEQLPPVDALLKQSCAL